MFHGSKEMKTQLAQQ